MKRTKTTMVYLVEDYLRVRRETGFALEIAGYRLLAFGRFADQAGHSGPVTFELAVRWAQALPCRSRLTSAWKLQILRPFLKYRSQFDPGTAIAPRGFFGSTHRRLVPHIYTKQEIVALLQAADHLVPTKGIRPATYRTLFGLLASTGLRISEALHLRPQEVDFAYGILILLCYKFQVPQKGQRQSFRSRERASKMRSVAMEYGLCRCGRMRASGLEVGRDLGS